MGRQAQEEVAAAARRRLELLGRELEQAGLRRMDEPLPDEDRGEHDRGGEDRGGEDRAGEDRAGEDRAGPAPAELPAPAPVAPVGRHLRAPRPGPAQRLGGWLADQVPDTLRGRVGLEPGSVLLVVALVCVAVVACAVVVLRARGGDETVPAAPGASAAAGASAAPLVSAAPSAPGSPTATPSGGASGAASGPEVTVDVTGKVRRPGVTTLPAGSRVVDALRRAGGARVRVDLSSLNLARVLVDGEQIVVGRPAQAGAVAAGAATAAPDASATGAAGALVNVNTATLDQLDTLPCVGPVTAQKVLDWRTAHGAFSSVDELLEVDGIGDKTLADLAPHVTL